MGVCFGYDDGREPAVRGEARPARPGVSRACLLTAWKANRAPAGPRASSCSVSGEAGMRAAKQTAPDVGKHCLGPAEINSPGARAGAGAGGRGVAGNGGWGGRFSLLALSSTPLGRKGTKPEATGRRGLRGECHGGEGHLGGSVRSGCRLDVFTS